MNCSYVSASSNLLKDPRIQVILRFFSVIVEALLTASQLLEDHLKTIFLLKSIIYLDPWTLESWSPCTLAYRPDLSAMIRTYILYITL